MGDITCHPIIGFLISCTYSANMPVLYQKTCSHFWCSSVYIHSTPYPCHRGTPTAPYTPYHPLPSLMTLTVHYCPLPSLTTLNVPYRPLWPLPSLTDSNWIVRELVTVNATYKVFNQKMLQNWMDKWSVQDVYFSQRWNLRVHLRFLLKLYVWNRHLDLVLFECLLQW